MHARNALFLTSLFLVSLVVPSATGVGLPSLPAVEQRPPIDPSFGRDAAAAPVVAPFGIIPPADPAPAQMNGFGPLPEGPYARFLSRAAATPDMTPNLLAAFAADYFADLGFNTLGAVGDFEENATLPYSYVLGDADGDGYDDVALDTYCTEPDACRPVNPLQYTNVRGFLDNTDCVWPHRILTYSGRTGFPLWNVTLDGNHPIGRQTSTGYYLGCSIEFVIGTVPNPETQLRDLLVYRWQVFWPLTQMCCILQTPMLNARTVARLDNTIYLLDAADGKVRWSQGPFTGTWVEEDTRQVAGPWTISAYNLFVNPILNVANPQGVQIVPKGTVPGLQLQGVGFNMTFDQAPVGVPYQTSYYSLVYSYQPIEWAMGVDPITGKKLFWRETFVPNERIGATPVTPARDIPAHPGPRVPHGNRSVWPIAFQSAPLPYTRCALDSTVTPCPISRSWSGTQWNTNTAPGRAQNFYWDHDDCCFDITGDTIPDLVYTVYEWSSTPTVNYDGPFMLASRLVAFNGADGQLLYDRYVRGNLELNFRYPPPLHHPSALYHMDLEFLGDANGDGTADYFLHERVQTWDYFANLTIISGHDGETLAKISWPRRYVVQPVGDADKDGGVDFLFFDYTFDWPAEQTVGRGDSYSLSNVTYTPISLHNGATGERRYQTHTFQAPNDLIYNLEQYRINGLPDYDGDDVADLWLDDPLFLPDLTTIHRFEVISVATNRTLFRVVSAGDFGFPSNTGDLTGDGIDDFMMLSGEPIDLWGTAYWGNNGTALWSRRIIATRTSGFVSGNPNMRTHLLHDASSPTPDFMVNFHFRKTQFTNIFGFGIFYATTTPQVTVFGGVTGEVPWSLPNLWDVNTTVMVPGTTPASAQFQDALKFNTAKDRGEDPEVVSVPTQVLVGVGTFAAAMGASFLLAGRRWRF